MTASLPLALVLFLAAVSPRDTQEAERLAKESIADYNLADFEPALAKINKAYRLDPRPEFLFNQGQCYRALHQWERAEFSYRGYLREKPDAFNRELVVGLIAEMQKKQEVARLEAEFPPVAPAPLVTAAPPLSAPEVAPAAVAKAEPPPPAAAEPSRSHALGITLGAIGVAALAGAAVGEGFVISFNQTNSQIQNGTYTGNYGSAVSAQNNANTGGTVALALVIVGAVAIAGAVLTW